MSHKGEALSSTHKPYFRGMGNTHPYNYWSVNVKAQCAEVDVVIFLFFVEGNERLSDWRLEFFIFL